MRLVLSQEQVRLLLSSLNIVQCTVSVLKSASMYTVSVLLNTSLHLCTQFNVRMCIGNSKMLCRYVHVVFIGRSAWGISFFVECYSVLLNVFNIISNLIY